VIEELAPLVALAGTPGVLESSSGHRTDNEHCSRSDSRGTETPSAKRCVRRWSPRLRC